MFFISAGTVHAITEGLLLYEVQQNSDTTFRLFDWGRKDASGKPRALYLREAAQVSDLREWEDYRMAPKRVAASGHIEDRLVTCPYFTWVKWHHLCGWVRLETQSRFKVVTVIRGEFSAGLESGKTHMATVETVLIPASQAAVELEADSGEAEFILNFASESAIDQK